MFPGADVPVIQLSLRRDLDPGAHLELGRVLAALRDDSVLIVGSGMSFHNMRGYGDARFTPVSAEFDDWPTNTMERPPAMRAALLREWLHAPQPKFSHQADNVEHPLPPPVAPGPSSKHPAP